jgi:hypothetical protein
MLSEVNAREIKEYSDYGERNSDYLLLRSDFNDLIDEIKKIYISKSYIGLMSWLIDRAFIISSDVKRNTGTILRNTNKNKALLLKILYDINPQNVLQIFSKNA